MKSRLLSRKPSWKMATGASAGRVQTKDADLLRVEGRFGVRFSPVRMIAVTVLCAVPLSASAFAQTGFADPPRLPKKPVPHTPIDKKAAELGETTWNPQWSKIVEAAIPNDLLSSQVPRDVRHFCPRFFTMTVSQKRLFWAYFFQALAGAEAGLDPNATARHNEPRLAREEDVPANKVRTEGLLQLTYADEERYGCPFNESADRGLPADDPSRTILQPKNNLTCGVIILENQLINQRKPLVTATSYWATLRPGTVGYRNFLHQMTNPPAACREHRARRHVAAVETANRK